MAANDYGIKVFDEPGRVRSNRSDIQIVSLEESERTTDPVKIYMKEMSRIPLLTRKEEIVLAKEIERGEEIVIKALSKTRFIQNEILSLEKLDKDDEIIFALFDSIEEEFAKGIVENKNPKILAIINETRTLSNHLEKFPVSKKYAVGRGRLIVNMSRLIKGLNIHSAYREKIAESLNKKLKVIDKLETSKQKLNAFLTSAKGKKEGEELKLRIKKVDTLLRSNKKEIGFDSQKLRKTFQTVNVHTEREANILKLRFGLGNGNEHTLEEVGQQYKVTRERIRQIQEKAIRKLKHSRYSRKLKSFSK